MIARPSDACREHTRDVASGRGRITREPADFSVDSLAEGGTGIAMGRPMLLRRGLVVVLLFVLACSSGETPRDVPADWVLFTNDKDPCDYYVVNGIKNFQMADVDRKHDAYP